jgi:hypothetical protein
VARDVGERGQCLTSCSTKPRVWARPRSAEVRACAWTSGVRRVTSHAGKKSSPPPFVRSLARRAPSPKIEPGPPCDLRSSPRPVPLLVSVPSRATNAGTSACRSRRTPSDEP